MENLTASLPTTSRDVKRTLSLVPSPDTPEHVTFLQDMLPSQDPDAGSSTAAGYMSDLEAATLETEELLLAAGLPVATPVGDDLPNVADPDADVHDAAVVSIQAGLVHRYMRHLPPLERITLRLHYGLGGSTPHSQSEVAARVGLSRASVQRVLDSGLASLAELLRAAPEFS